MTQPTFHDASCVGKPGFATRPHASRVMKNMLRCRDRRGGKLQVYRCRSCRQWHIGSTVVGLKRRGSRPPQRPMPSHEEEVAAMMGAEG